MEEFRVGEHLFRWEPPDVTFLAYVGDVDGDSAHRLAQIARKFTIPRPYIFALIDLSRVDKITAGARKSATEDSVGVPMRGVALFGASRAIRVLTSIVARAVDLIHGGDNPTRFFATEAEARAWIAERRKVVLTADAMPQKQAPN
jgi:hypothetical protein